MRIKETNTNAVVETTNSADGEVAVTIAIETSTTAVNIASTNLPTTPTKIPLPPIPLLSKKTQNGSKSNSSSPPNSKRTNADEEILPNAKTRRRSSSAPNSAFPAHIKEMLSGSSTTRNTNKTSSGASSPSINSEEGQESDTIMTSYSSSTTSSTATAVTAATATTTPRVRRTSKLFVNVASVTVESEADDKEFYQNIHLLSQQPKGSRWKDISNVYTIVRTIGKSWSWAEITFGLEYYTRHQSQQSRDFSSFVEIAKQTTVGERKLAKWRRFAFLTYTVFRDSVHDIVKKCGIKQEHIITFDKNPIAMRPCYFLCIDEITQSILLIFRGTKSFSDVITDLHASSTKLKNGYAHRGIYAAAQWFCNNKFIVDLLKKLLRQFPEYKLTLLGHSLGGGTASILSLLWKEEFPDIRCYAYACPPVLSLELAQGCAEYVTTFINGDDFVPRLSTTSLEVLRKEVASYPWKEEMMKEINNSAIAKIAKGTRSYITSMATGLRKIALRIAGSSNRVVDEYQEPKSSINGEQAEPIAIEEIEMITNVLEQEVSKLDEKVKPSAEEIEAMNYIDAVTSSAEAEATGNTAHEGQKPVTSTSTDTPEQTKHDANPEPHHETFSIPLYPAGKIYGMRLLNNVVYVKRAHQKEFDKLVLSDSFKADHKMINYNNNLLRYSFERQLLPNSTTAVAKSKANANSNSTPAQGQAKLPPLPPFSLLNEYHQKLFQEKHRKAPPKQSVNDDLKNEEQPTSLE